MSSKIPPPRNHSFCPAQSPNETSATIRSPQKTQKGTRGPNNTVRRGVPTTPKTPSDACQRHATTQPRVAQRTLGIGTREDDRTPTGCHKPRMSVSGVNASPRRHNRHRIPRPLSTRVVPRWGTLAFLWFRYPGWRSAASPRRLPWAEMWHAVGMQWRSTDGRNGSKMERSWHGRSTSCREARRD